MSDKTANDEKKYEDVIKALNGLQEVKAPTNKINVYKLEIKKFKYPDLKIIVQCSAGTYIRSLAHDLGKAMSTGALLSDLRRTDIGDYSVKDAVALNKASAENLAKNKLDIATNLRSLNQWFYQSLP